MVYLNTYILIQFNTNTHFLIYIIIISFKIFSMFKIKSTILNIIYHILNKIFVSKIFNNIIGNNIN